MNDKILFYEKQRFTQWWFWLLFIGLNGLILYGVIQQVILDKPFGTKPASDSGLIIVAVLLILITVLLISFRLETKINQDGVYVRFFPFYTKFKFHSWDTISKAYIRKYSPIREYGGWGWRYGAKGNELNISGNKGLQLNFTDRKSLLIGTRQPESISKVLAKLNKLAP